MSFFFLFLPSQASIYFQLKPLILPKLQYQSTCVMLIQSNKAQISALFPQKLRLQSMADQVINATMISLKLTFSKYVAHMVSYIQLPQPTPCIMVCYENIANIP